MCTIQAVTPVNPAIFGKTDREHIKMSVQHQYGGINIFQKQGGIAFRCLTFTAKLIDINRIQNLIRSLLCHLPYPSIPMRRV